MTFDDNEMLMLKYFSENKTFTLENFMKDTKLKKKEAEQILVNYILIGMLTMTITEKVTYFALQEDENNKNIYRNINNYVVSFRK